MKTLPILIMNISGYSEEIPQWAKEKTPVKMAYYLGLGPSFPVGDNSDDWNNGFHGFGRLDFSASPKLNIWAGGDIHYFPFKDQPDTSVNGHDITIINLSADLKVSPSPSKNGVSPYFFLGAILSIQSISDSTFRIYGDTLVNLGVVSYETQTGGLIECGAGVEYKSFFLQTRYITRHGTGGYVPVTVGVKF